jgi:hypothetical protein
VLRCREIESRRVKAFYVEQFGQEEAYNCLRSSCNIHTIFTKDVCGCALSTFRRYLCCLHNQPGHPADVLQSLASNVGQPPLKC